MVKKTISISPGVHKALKAYKKSGETFNDTLKRLLLEICTGRDLQKLCGVKKVGDSVVVQSRGLYLHLK